MRGHQTWADHTATSRRPPAVQIQENEVMQVASLCYNVEPALAGIGRFSQDDVLELQLFKLEHDILLQAQSLANKHRSSFREERWVMSKENLARCPKKIWPDSHAAALRQRWLGFGGSASSHDICRAIQVSSE